MATDTPKEAIDFSANLRLPRELSKEDKDEKVNSIIS